MTKELLIEKIKELENSEALHDIERILEIYDLERNNDNKFSFTANEIELIKEAELALETGQTYSHKEVLSIAETWFEK